MRDEALPGSPSDSRSYEMSLGNLTINFDTYRVWVEGEVIDLTYQEFECLRLLATQPDRILPYDSLAKVVLNGSSRSEIRHLNVIIHRLRTKLARIHPYVIETVRGRGYGLVMSLKGQAHAS